MSEKRKRTRRPPVVRRVLAIRKGDTPETNPVSKIVLGWVDEFQKALEAEVKYVSEIAVRRGEVMDGLIEQRAKSVLVPSDELTKIKAENAALLAEVERLKGNQE